MGKKIESASFFIGKGGGGLISFGSGQPDLPPPQQIYRAQNHFKTFRYGLVQGEKKLRDALAEGYARANGDEFVITNGASEALDLLLRAISRRGGKILLPKPYYYSYPHNVRLAGMVPGYYHLRDGKIDYDDLEKKSHGKNVRAILINSPSNPTGTVQDVPVLKKIEALADRLGDTCLISDEIYKDLIYERENYVMKGRNVCTINSFSKTYAMCGIRVGYVHAKNKKIVERMVEIKTHTSMNTNTLAQEMAYEALRSPKNLVREQLEIWRERRDYIYKSMVDLGLDLWKPEGAFYVFPKFKDPERAMHDLFYTYQIITYNGAWFGDPTRLRFSYALDIKQIKKGMERLAMFLGKEYRRY
jgi:aspartate aminotransferase